MPKLELSKSMRKHIRSEKARIRRGIFNTQEQKKQIDKLYADILRRQQPDNNAKKPSDTPIPTIVKNVVSTVVKGEAVVYPEKA